MKKRNIKLLTILLSAVLIAGLSVFYACKKEETITSSISNPLSEQGIFKSQGNSSIINPFDKNHEYLEEVLEEVVDFLLDIDNNYSEDDFNRFLNDFDKLMNKYEKNNPYPKFDINEYSSVNQNIILGLIDSYRSNIKIIGLEEATEQTERTISLISDIDLQQTMFSLVSQFHFNCFVMENIGEIMGAPPGWGERFSNCMWKKADAMENSNAVDIALCLAQSVMCPLGWAASCAWDASFNKHLHHSRFD